MAEVTFFCRFVCCGKLPTKIKMPLNNKRVKYLEQTWFCWIVVLFLQMIKICSKNPMNIDGTTFLLWTSSFFLTLFTVLTTNIRRTIYSGNRNVCYHLVIKWQSPTFWCFRSSQHHKGITSSFLLFIKRLWKNQKASKSDWRKRKEPIRVTCIFHTTILVRIK